MFINLKCNAAATLSGVCEREKD